jgi:phosphoribosylformylglycinamidine synthase
VLSDPPQYDLEPVRPPELDRLQAEDLAAHADLVPAEANSMLLRVLGSENIASRRWIWRQYDHQVLNHTVIKPGGDAAVLWLRGTSRGVAVATDCNGRFVALDPRTGAAMAVAEAARNVVATGATPAAITDCLNFGNPEKPGVAYQIEQSILGLSEAARALGTPVISGNASLYNEVPEAAVLPTPAIGLVGVLQDIERRIEVAFHASDGVVLLGAEVAQAAATLAGSEYQALTLGRAAGQPRIDLDLEARTQRLVLDAHARGLLTSAHDCSEGGLAVALAESCMAGGTGFDGAAVDAGARLDAALFGEAPSRFVVGTRDAQALLDLARAANVPAVRLGTAGGDRLRLGPVEVEVAVLRDVYERALPERLAGTEAE